MEKFGVVTEPLESCPVCGRQVQLFPHYTPTSTCPVHGTAPFEKATDVEMEQSDRQLSVPGLEISNHDGE